jgi:hypothetical protein
MTKQCRAGAAVRLCCSKHFERSALLRAELTLLLGIRWLRTHRGNSGKAPPVRRGKSSGRGNRVPIRDTVEYLNHPPAMVAYATQANDIHRNLARSPSNQRSPIPILAALPLHRDAGGIAHLIQTRHGPDR